MDQFLPTYRKPQLFKGRFRTTKMSLCSQLFLQDLVFHHRMMYQPEILRNVLWSAKIN